MEEKYYLHDEEYTWRQLLFAFSKLIESRYKKRWKSKNLEAVNAFFKDFKHNDNDGVWTEGHYKRIPVFDENRRIIKYVNGDWVDPVFTPKNNVVFDSYGRIIPSGYLKKEYASYVPNEQDRKPKKFNLRYKRWACVHTYEFRKDPVPNKGRWPRGGWHKYRGDHGHTIQELRESFVAVIEQKEVKQEYGVTFKLGRNKNDLDPWNHGHHVGCHGFGWKRSKKEKQWMKHSWKRVYSKFPEEELVDPFEE